MDNNERCSNHIKALSGVYSQCRGVPGVSLVPTTHVNVSPIRSCQSIWAHVCGSCAFSCEALTALPHVPLSHKSHHSPLSTHLSIHLSIQPSSIIHPSSVQSHHPSRRPSFSLDKLRTRPRLLKQPGRQAVRYLNPTTISKQWGDPSIQPAPTYSCIQ